MSFNFPNSPTVNQVFIAPNGPTYVWDGEKWEMTGTSGVVTADSYNRVVNGAMQHSQENGNNNGTTNGFYCADQWSGQVSGLTMTTIQRIVPAAGGPITIIEVPVVKASLAASDYFGFRQVIEGSRIHDLYWGTANAKQVILRFEAHSSTGGTYAVALRNVPQTHSGVFNFTLPAGIYTVVSLVIPGPTIGTWAIDNSGGIEIYIT